MNLPASARLQQLLKLRRDVDQQINEMRLHIGDLIILAVANETDLPDFLTNRTKQRRYTEARALAYHIARRAGWSLPRISRWAGHHHSTIHHALNAHDLADEAEAFYHAIMNGESLAA